MGGMIEKSGEYIFLHLGCVRSKLHIQMIRFSYYGVFPGLHAQMESTERV